MIELSYTTFIIPIYIESQDRYNNAVSVLGYLNHHFRTNIVIHELVDSCSRLEFLGKFSNLTIKHIIKYKAGDFYHRTLQLNEMLDIVSTPVTVNYDIDVVLPATSYILAEKDILEGKGHLIYPYGLGNFQKMVHQTFDRSFFNKEFSVYLIDKSNKYNINISRCGHCQFFNTEIYRRFGGENEYFISYAPEDHERMVRFQKLGFNVNWIPDYIYHFEHYRSVNSTSVHNNFKSNEELLKKILKLDKNQLLEYYSQVEYMNKYKNIHA